MSIYKDNDLIAVTKKIHDLMLENVSYYATPPITLTTYNAFITAYKAACNTALDGSKEDTSNKNDLKSVLIKNTRSLGFYVNQLISDTYAASSNTMSYSSLETLILQSGFKLSKTPGPIANTGGMKVPIIEKFLCKVSGTLYIKLRQYVAGVRGKLFFNIRVRTSEIPAHGTTPAVPAGDWTVRTFSSGNINIDDLTKGVSYDIQAAAIGGHNTKLNKQNQINWTIIRSIIIT
jgi:hypothetical protein